MYGELIWSGAQYGESGSYSHQTYLNQSVIALWVGKFNGGGWGDGYDLLIYQTYTVVANVWVVSLQAVIGWTPGINGRQIDHYREQPGR